MCLWRLCEWRFLFQNDSLADYEYYDTYALLYSQQTVFVREEKDFCPKRFYTASYALGKREQSKIFPKDLTTVTVKRNDFPSIIQQK